MAAKHKGKKTFLINQCFKLHSEGHPDVSMLQIGPCIEFSNFKLKQFWYVAQCANKCACHAGLMDRDNLLDY